MESTASMEALKRMAFKKEVLGAKKLFEAAAQVPSPHKDWAQVIITERGVVWRKWKITLRGIAQGTAPAPSPTEEAMSFEDFKCDTTLQHEVERIFGVEVMRQTRRILSGSMDELSKLPEDLMVRLATYLDLQSIAQLSQTNRHLREVCNSDPLWKKLFKIHQGSPSGEIVELAKEVSWKVVFFMNKLQLQKELSRRRRLHSPHRPHHDHSAKNGSTAPSASATFLTQAF